MSPKACTITAFFREERFKVTRQEFIYDVQDWYDLIRFCDEMGIYNCEDVYTRESMDELLDEELVDIARGHGWREMLGILNNFPDGDADYYIRDEYGDFVEADYDAFEAYKSDVIEYCDDEEMWDEEEEEEEEEESGIGFRPYVEESAEDNHCSFDVDEPFSVGDLFLSSSDQLQQIQVHDIEVRLAEDDAYKALIQL